MAQPSSRQTLIDYCKRQLGAPVLKINVADEQIDDLLDDALQFFQERHFDGVEKTYLKYKLTQTDIDRGKGTAGITTTTVSDGGIDYDYEEDSRYLPLPDGVIGVERILHFNGSNNISSGMFNFKYQLFLNDIHYLGSTELLTYQMTQTFLSDIDHLLTTQKKIRFNQRKGRLYIDMDWNEAVAGEYLVLDSYAIADPSSYTKVYNDSFLKRYLTSLIKRQWGMNLIKFQGVKLPGGIELNGRQLYDDAQKEIDTIMEQMPTYYEMPPLDMIG